MTSLLSVNPHSLSDAEIDAHVVEWQRHLDIANAKYAQALAVWHQRKSWAEDGSRSSGHALARKTGASPKDMNRKIRRSRLLQTMPLTLAQFQAGHLSESRVNLLCSVNRPHVRDKFVENEQWLLDLITPLAFHEAEKALAYWLNAVDPDGSEDRNKKLYEDRYLQTFRNHEGVLSLQGQLGVTGSEIFQNELTRLADEMFEADWAEAKVIYGNDVSLDKLKRTNAQRRADALVRMAVRSAAKPAGAKEARVLMTLVCGEEAFKGLIETGSGVVLANGAIIPHLNDIDIETVIFDGKSRIIDFKGKRRFDGALERAIKARDGFCQDSSVCDVPAERCQIDHDQA